MNEDQINSEISKRLDKRINELQIRFRAKDFAQWSMLDMILNLIEIRDGKGYLPDVELQSILDEHSNVNSLYGVFCEYTLDCGHWILKFVGNHIECSAYAKQYENSVTVSTRVEPLTRGELKDL